MTTLTETNHTAEFLISEGNGSISRESISVIAGDALPAGQVLGKITVGTTATATAAAGNTGDGTVGVITLGSNTKRGVYTLTIIQAAVGAGVFQVEAPDGKVVGTGNVGTAFSKGGLSFTITAGEADFVAGDTITIAVAAGSGKWKAYAADNIDGSQEAAGILYAPLPASSSDRTGVAIVRLAEVASIRLTGIDAAGIAGLNMHNIIIR